MSNVTPLPGYPIEPRPATDVFGPPVLPSPNVSGVAASAVGAAIAEVLVANRCGLPNLVQTNAGTAGYTGKGSVQYGNCGLKTVPIATAGTGMTPGDYPLTISGGTPTTAATGTYTVNAAGICSAVTITFPGIGYNSAPAVAAGGSPGGTLPTFTSTIGATANEFNSFQGYTLTEDCEYLVLREGNFMPNASTPGQTDNGPSNLTLRVGIRINGVATGYPVYFPNGRGVVLEPGQVADSMRIPGPWAKGSVVILQKNGVYASVPAQWPVFTGAVQSGGYEVAEFGTNLTDHSLRGSAIGGAVHASNWAVLPSLGIYGKPLSKDSKRLALFGDSIASTGSNDSGSGGYVGFFQRGVGANYALTNLGASGYGINAFMANSDTARLARRRKFQALADVGITHAFTNWGTNDLSGAASDISATIVANLVALQAELANYGIKLIPMTCCPRTDTANTTVNGADTVNGWNYVNSLNTLIRSTFSVYYDLNAFMRDSSNPNLWNTARNPGAVDGIHPSGADHIACAADFAAALPGLLAAA